MPEPKKIQKKKPISYKDDDGNTLYGFSQTHLEETNRKLNNLVLGVQVLIILFFVLMLGFAMFMGWVAYNDVITRMIYGS
nr:hypothetical protein [Candidatus Woesearchaeota archaeon]